MILGIDQSLTSTGFFLLDEENTKLCKYGIITSNKALSNFRRAGDISNEILNLVAKHEPVAITIEGLPFMSKSNVTRDLAGLQYVIVLDLLGLGGYTLDLDLFIVPPTQLKKFATGSGKADKQAMFEALPANFRNSIGKTPKSKGRYDITDAYWLAKYGKETYVEHTDI